MALFGSSRSSATKLSCFGKLPTYGDFLSLNNDGAGAQRIGRWLQEAVGLFRTGLPGPSDQFVHYVWPVRGSRRTILGVLWPSGDAAGRRFPFTLFSEIPSSVLEKHGALRLFAAEPVWRKVHELYGRVQTMSSAKEQYGAMHEATLPVPSPLEEVAALQGDRTASPTLDGVSRAALSVHVSELIAFADRLSDAPPDLEFALRSRVHGSVDAVAEAFAWLSILERRLGRGDRASPLFLRVSPSERTQSVFEFHRDLTPMDLGHLLAPSSEPGPVERHGFRDIPGSQDEERFRDAFVHYWGTHAPSCETLLELGARTWSQAEIDAAPPAPPVVFAQETADGITGPTAVTAAADDEGLGEEITGEIVLETTGVTTGVVTDGLAGTDSFPEPDPVPEGAFGGEAFAPETPVDESNEQSTSSVDRAAPLTDDDHRPAGRYADVAALAERLDAMLREAPLAGRVIALATRDAQFPGRPAPSTERRYVYVESGRDTARELDHAELVRLRLAQRVDAHAEARALIDEIRAAHEAIAAELERRVEDATHNGADPLFGY